MIGAIRQMKGSFEPGYQMGDSNVCEAMDYIGGMGDQMDLAVSA